MSKGPGEERRLEQELEKEEKWIEVMSEEEGLDPVAFVQHSN